jgi:WXG100 family type VII secretion target
MPAPKVRADYEQLAAIAGTFGRQAEVIRSMFQSLSRQKQTLEGGDWVGKSADKFYAEMNSAVLPTVKRLIDALNRAQQVTRQISKVMKDAENASAALFRAAGTGDRARSPGSPGPAAAPARAKSGGGFWGGVKDFFGGIYAEGKDMVTGLYHMVTDPVGTAKALWHGITHPGELWDAFKKPFVEDWESGHPWRAIGRGVMFVGSMLVGTKGADKIGKAGKLGEAGHAARAAELAKAGRTAELMELAKMGRLGEGASQFVTKFGDDAGRLLAKGNLTPDELARLAKLPDTPAGLVDDLATKIGDNIKGNPLRMEYEGKVRGLGDDLQKMINDGKPIGEAEARHFYDARRNLGVEYKDLSPKPLRDYIYEVNTKRYGDPLGLKWEDALVKYDGDFQKIAEAATRPNPDVNKLLGGFKDWLGGKDTTALLEAQVDLMRAERAGLSASDVAAGVAKTGLAGKGIETARDANEE